MRRLALTFFILTGFILTASADNFISVSVSAGMPFLRDMLEITTERAGIGGRVGIGWQYQRNMFVLETGVEGGYHMQHVDVKDTAFSIPMTDSGGKSFIYNGQLTNRNDGLRSIDLLVPLMLGVELQYFYALAGARLSINLKGTSFSNAQFSSSGDYDRYYETLTDMPNHGFESNRPLKYSTNTSISVDTRICVELGGIISRRSAYQTGGEKYRLGLFAEFGVLDLNKHIGEGSMAAVDMSNYMSIDIKNIYYSDEGKYTPLHNATIGLRLSVLFRIGKSTSSFTKRYKCQCEKDLYW